MNIINLSHLTAASRVTHCITRAPKKPVVLHWQLPRFPTRLALALAKNNSLIWVVSTTERGDIAKRELEAAGIKVTRQETLSLPLQTGTETLSSAEKMDRYRKKLQKRLANSTIQHAGVGTASIVPIGRLYDSKPLDDIVSCKAPLVVFDHLGSLNARWLKLDSSDGPNHQAKVIPLRDKSAHPIPNLQAAGISTVFLARDELEVALLSADMAERAVPPTVLTTAYSRPSNLAISIVGTDLVRSKFATGAFLSILTCNPDAQVVGESLIGAITPHQLSMDTSTPLRRAVLRLSHPHKDVLEVAKLQTGLSTRELRDIRVRDFVRTAILATDPRSRKPELVVICAWQLANEVAAMLGGVAVIRLNAWHPSGFQNQGRTKSKFADNVIGAATSYPNALAHGSRLVSIAGAIARERNENRPKKIAKLAFALHSGTALQEIDVTGLAQDYAGLSSLGDAAIGLFNRILDETYPWSPCAPSSNSRNLESRRRIRKEYEVLRQRHLRKS